MLDLTLEIVMILVSAGTTLGLMRFYFKAETGEERKQVVASAFLLLLGLNSIGSAFLAIAAPFVRNTILSNAGSVGLVYIAAANFTTGTLAIVPLLLMQIQQRPTLFVITSVGKLLVQLVLIMVLLVGLGWGPAGVLTSTLISNVVVGLPALTWMLRQTGLHPTRTAVRDLRRFAVPHQFGAAGMFILAFGDRFFLEKWHGLAAVGVYSLAYNFGFLLSNLGSASYLQAWNPQRFQLVNDPRLVRDGRYNEGLDSFSLFLGVLFVGIALFGRPLLIIMSDSAYHAAADLIPLLSFAYVLQGLTGVVHFSIDVSERSKYSSYATWISAVVIVCLYALLIPSLGGWGAAIATVACFFLRFALCYYWGQRLWPVIYKWGGSARIFGAALIIVVIDALFHPNRLLQLVGWSAALGLTYAFVVWFWVLSDGQRRLARELAWQNPRHLLAQLRAQQ